MSTPTPNKHRVLAVDPGFERLGLAVIERDGKDKVLYSSCFKTSPKLPFAERLALLGEEVRRLIEAWEPDALAIERLYLSVNEKTAMGVAEARGVVLYEAGRAGIHVHEYTPLQVKVAVCGYGRADKRQVMAMVPKLIVLPRAVTSDDEMDALAIGITFFAHYRPPALKRR